MGRRGACTASVTAPAAWRGTGNRASPLVGGCQLISPVFRWPSLGIFTSSAAPQPCPTLPGDATVTMGLASALLRGIDSKHINKLRKVK